MKRTGGITLAIAGMATAAYVLVGQVPGPVAGAVTGAVGVVTGALTPAPGPVPTPVTVPGSSPVVSADRVTLADLIYYGTCWWQFPAAPNVVPPVLLGNGYRTPRVWFDDQGDFFAGTVEKVDASGRVTDVILGFAAAKTSDGGNPAGDITDNSLMTYGGGSPQATRAAQIYAALWADPAYADARIHVTGLSLGSAFTQYALGYSIRTYGKAATAARAEFVHFGVPGYAQGIATHFGLTIADFDGLITGYTPKNDPTPNNSPPGGLQHGQPDINARLMGTMHWLADYQPHGSSPLVAAQNGLAAHQSLAYIGALGAPAWMSASDRRAVIDTILANGPAQTAYDPAYGTGGSVAQTIIGDGAANALTGTASEDGLQGRGGADLLTGGGGRNSFIYAAASDSTLAAPDLVTDFKPGDTIDLTGFGRLVGFAFVGPQRPTRAGTVGYRIVDGETLVEVNTGGGATPDMVIRLAGTRALTAGDFALGGTLSAAAAYLTYQLFNTTGHPFLDHALIGFSFNP